MAVIFLLAVAPSSMLILISTDMNNSSAMSKLSKRWCGCKGGHWGGTSVVDVDIGHTAAVLGRAIDMKGIRSNKALAPLTIIGGMRAYARLDDDSGGLHGCVPCTVITVL